VIPQFSFKIAPLFSKYPLVSENWFQSITVHGVRFGEVFMSLKKRYLSLLTLALLVAAGYFLSTQITGAPEARVPEYSDPARPVKTRIGSHFVIVLDSNPTTGYGWQLGESFDKTMFEVTEIRYEPSNGKRLAGAGGKQTWMFRALCAGNAVIDFEYLRPWEKDIPPVKKVRFAVTVR